MNGLNGLMMSSALLQKALIIAVVTALVAGTAGVYTAISATDLAPSPGDESIAPGVNSFIADAEVVFANADVSIVPSSGGAVGGSAPGVEATSALPAVNNALTADNYSYTFEMKESANTDWQAGEDFRIRVYGYDSAGPTNTLFATLYVQQAVVDDAAIDGVTVTVDTGVNASVFDNYDVIVDRQ